MSRNNGGKVKISESGVITEQAMMAYLRNELTPDEKLEFEKLLKEDPFAQDALEGLQLTTDKETIPALVTSINKKVRQKTRLTESGGLHIRWSMYAAAAAVFVLLIGVGVLLYTFLPLHNTPIAMNKTAEVPAETSKQAEEKLLPATGSVATEIPPAENKNETPVLQKAAEANNNKDVEKVIAADKKIETKNTAEGKKEETLKHVGNASSASAQQVTVTFSGGSMAENTMKEKSLEGFAADNKTAAAGVVQHETKAKAEKQNRNEEQPTPAAAYEMRGSIAERVEVEKPVLITLDDAMKNFDNGEYKKSAEQFDEILKAQPENADALYFGGISDYINGNGKRAEKSFDKLMKKGTKFLDGSKWYKANILLSKGKKEEARKLLDELSVTGGSYKERAIKKRAEMDF